MQPSAHSGAVSTRASFFQRLSQWWAARTLALGVVATALDLGLGMTLRAFGVPTRTAAMSGTTLGATFNFFANRSLAFRDHQQPFVRSVIKYVVMAVTLSAIHGQVTTWLCDGKSLPYPLAKVLADVLVITLNQPLLLRYFVFPRHVGGNKPSVPRERGAS